MVPPASGTFGSGACRFDHAQGQALVDWGRFGQLRSVVSHMVRLGGATLVFARVAKSFAQRGGAHCTVPRWIYSHCGRRLLWARVSVQLGWRLDERVPSAGLLLFSS